MNLNKTDKQLIMALLNSHDFISSYELSEVTGISRRTIRDRMPYIKNILKKYNFNLISKTSNGYLIENLTPARFEYLSNIINESEKDRESLYPITSFEREKYIVSRILYENDYIKMDDLADDLYISRATISAELKAIRKSLMRHNLTILHRPNYGINVMGDEKDKRKYLCDLYFDNINDSGLFNDYLDNFSLHDTVENEILNTIMNDGILFSDTALCDMLISITVAIKRILLGCTLTKEQDMRPIQDLIEIQTAHKIKEVILRRIQIELSEIETNEIAIQLVCKRSVKDLQPSNHEKSLKVCYAVLDRIEEEIGVPLRNKEFINLFKSYIDVSLLRVYYNEKVRHPLFSQIRQRYPLAYDCANIVSEEFYKLTSQYLSRSQKAFFTTIFEKEIYRLQSKKNRALIVFGIGNGLNTMCAEKIQHKYYEQLEVVKYVPYYGLQNEDLSKYDVIISNYGIHKELPIPTIHISPELTEKDFQLIESYLIFYGKNWHIKSYFQPSLFVKNVNIQNKASILQEFRNMMEKYDPEQKRNLQNKIIQSKVEKTKCYNNILFVKMKEQAYTRTILPVLILDKPLMYDGQNINIIILFSGTKNDEAILPKLESMLSDISQEQIDNVLKDANYKNFTSLFDE